MKKISLAWSNAITLENRNKNQVRMCYLCKRLMNHGTKWNYKTNPTNGWNIDHVDGNPDNNNLNNLVAVHYKCNGKKGNKDKTYLYNDIKSRCWVVKKIL